MSTRTLIVAALLTLPACSAIVEPDSRRLGTEPDTGIVGFDAGPPNDANRVDPDAVILGVDSGPLTCAGGCNDGLACTTDRCVMGVCESTTVDGDGDGQISTECTGLDCNDSNGRVFSGAPEVCGDSIDNNCDGSVDEGCAPPDNCASAQRVTLTGGRATVTGDTTGLMANYVTPCASWRRNPDAVYRIDVPAGVDLRIETSGSVDAVLAVSTTCGAFESAQCNDDSTHEDTNARVWLHNAPGTWYVLVTGFAVGPYSVSFETTPTATDRCGDGVLDITSGGTVVGIPVEMRAVASCGGDRTRESIFVYNHNTFRILRMTSAFRSVLSVRARDCNPASEQDCAVASTGGGGGFQSSLAGTWEAPLYLIADGGMGDSAYALTIQP